LLFNHGDALLIRIININTNEISIINRQPLTQ